jgi:hypothetical protein
MPRADDPQSVRTYEFPAGVTLRLRSDQRDVLAHFDAEYGDISSGASGNANIEVCAGRSAISSSPVAASTDEMYEARHKTVTWRVAISGLEADTTTVTFEGRGQLVVSFLQTFYVEPLLRLKFLERDHALVHAASLTRDTGSVLFAAGSGVGKSTLMLRHAASGKGVQGDNYVILSAQGKTLAFPRRLRIYSDLARVSPDIFGRLPADERWRLKAAGLIRRLSLGYANMPRRLTIEDVVGAGRLCREARLEGLYFLKRHNGEGLAGPSSVPPGEAISRIQAINKEEATRLEEALADYRQDAATTFNRADVLERDILTRALAGVPALELLVPRVRNPSAIVAEISRACGLDGPA